MKRKFWSAAAASCMAVMMLSSGVLAEENTENGILIECSEEEILVDGEAISEEKEAAVYVGAEIVYYKEGQGSTYGEGDAEDEHSEEEALAHTVITITQPGTYRISGTLEQGQIAIDLGEDAKEDEEAVVNLILDDANVTCTVAPAIVVYHAYECGSDDIETAAKDVDTSHAGFNLILADGSENYITGSHVAKIYKDGTTQEDIDADTAKKKWKFDAAIDSLVSYTIDTEEEGDGKLFVDADNEGIQTALHLTINGGEISIKSSDDAINASEDYVSVLTINDGIITCDSDYGKEGDGIDSNGWIVINGGYTIASANADSQDSGVDADMGIYLNGGTVLASGNMYDEVSEDSEQMFLVLSFSQKIEAGELLMLKNEADEPVIAFSAANAFQTLVFGSDMLEEGDYTLYQVSSVNGELNGSIYTDISGYSDAVQLEYQSTGIMGFGGGRPGNFNGDMSGLPQRPEGFGDGNMPQMPEDFRDGNMMQKPEGFEGGEIPSMPEGFDGGEIPSMPEGFNSGDRGQMPEGFDGGEIPSMPENFDSDQYEQESSTVFSLNKKSNTFSGITEAK